MFKTKIFLIMVFIVLANILLQASTIPSAEENIDMVLIPAGEIEIGNSNGYDDEKPTHKVYLDAFYIDKYEVTNEQFAKFWNVYGKRRDEQDNMIFMGREITRIEGKYQAVKGYEKCPVTGVTWYGAIQYAKWVGKRLPTEAEWERACKDNKDLSNDETKMGKYAWFKLNSEISTHPIGTKEPNAYGLYDMFGNAAEWCNDWYDEEYYASVLGTSNASAKLNPQGPDKGKFKVNKGGSYLYRAKNLRSSFRQFKDPGDLNMDIGFRCVKSVK